MPQRFLGVSGLLLGLLLSTFSAAAPKALQPSSGKNRGVDWEAQVLRVTGKGAPDVRAHNTAQARLGAEKTAHLDAVRSLMALIQGLPLDGERTVAAELAKNETLRAQVETLLGTYQATHKRYFSDGGLEMEVEAPLAPLISLLLPKPETPVVILSETPVEKTGLVVDTRGLKVLPALAPRLLDPEGHTVYSFELLTDEARKDMGVAAYSPNVAAAVKNPRVGAKPLVLKATKVEGTNLILSDKDVKKLTSMNQGFLAAGRVVIVSPAAKRLP